jgi:AcrR family transcriptional regulator
MSPEPARRLGRPRDSGIDERVLEATRQLLTEVGFEATTIQAITQRSGEHPSAIYRRWPSRIALIERAVFPGMFTVQVPATGDLRQDLRRFIRANLAAFGAPEARAAMPGLLAHYQASVGEEPDDRWLAVSTRPQFRDILAKACPDAVDPAVDADDVFDVLLGAMLARTLVDTVAHRHRPIERLVELAERLVRPCPGLPPG